MSQQDPPFRKFGLRLKAERESLGLTQEQLAAACQVAKSTYTYYEAGARLPDAAFLSRAAAAGVNIAFVMDVPVGQLMPDPQLPSSRVEAAVKAVREAEIERLAFLEPSLLWIAVQHVAKFGEATKGGYLANARAKLDELLGTQRRMTRGRTKR